MPMPATPAEQETMDGSPSRVRIHHSDKLEGGLPSEDVLMDRKALGLPWIYIKFQAGPVKEVGGVNGVGITDVANVLIDRLKGYQNGPFRCDENAEAMAAFQKGVQILLNRTKKRKEQGVEGENKPHTS